MGLPSREARRHSWQQTLLFTYSGDTTATNAWQVSMACSTVFGHSSPGLMP
jgi:hypothetical protein